MDSIGPISRPNGLWPLVFALVLTAVACQSDDRSESPSTLVETPSPIAPLSPSALQIAPEQLSRLELLTKGTQPAERRVEIEKTDQGWQIVSPLTYPANPTAVESMVAVMAEIEVVTRTAADPQAEGKTWLDRARGVEVKAWAGNRLQSHFIVGRSTAEQTYVQIVGDPRVLTVRGRCRPIFGKTLDEFRHPNITQIPVTAIAAVSYSNEFGVLEFVADPTEPGKFLPKGTAIRNFDRDRASQQIGVLAQLFAKGFVDRPRDPAATGLFDADTPRATLSLRDAAGMRTVTVWVGTRTRDRLHLRTSEGEQIYLVSAHLETTLLARRSHLERSNETMRQRKALAEKANRAKDGRHAHTHGHASTARSQLPPELMRVLRQLARDQGKER